jgi:hypothetical protein
LRGFSVWLGDATLSAFNSLFPTFFSRSDKIERLPKEKTQNFQMKLGECVHFGAISFQLNGGKFFPKGEKKEELSQKRG